MRQFDSLKFVKMLKRSGKPTHSSARALHVRNTSTTTTTLVTESKTQCTSTEVTTEDVQTRGTDATNAKLHVLARHITPATPFLDVPHHDEIHAGPYGVETPPDWSFAFTITEVSVVIKGGDESRDTVNRKKVEDTSTGAGDDARSDDFEV